MEKLILYSAQQNEIGGIERFNLNFCKRMSKYYDITFVYDTGHQDRLKEIRQYAKVELNKGQNFIADTCLFSTAWGTIRNDQIFSKLYPQLMHADLTQYKGSMFFTYNRRPMVTRHACVGQNVANSLKKEYGLDGKVIYNLLDNELEYKKHEKKSSTDVLKIIVASRISQEKGFERLILLVEALKRYGGKFIIDIYGNSYSNDYEKFIKGQLKKYPEVVFHGAKWTLTQEMHDATYLWQGSDTEGMPYSPREALQVGTPCILTDYPAAHEIVKDGVNGYILDMNLSNLDVTKLYNKIPVNFEYKEESTEQDWLEFLKHNPNEKVKVINKVNYTDLQRNREMKAGEPFRWESLERAFELVRAGYCEIYFQKNESEIKEKVEDHTITNILNLLRKEN